MGQPLDEGHEDIELGVGAMENPRRGGVGGEKNRGNLGIWGLRSPGTRVNTGIAAFFQSPDSHNGYGDGLGMDFES